MDVSPTSNRRLLGALHTLGRLALDWIYPPICLACESPVGESGGLCPACWLSLSFIERPFCERLGSPFAQDLGPALLSPEAIANPPDFERARAAVRYGEGPAQKLVHALKYSDRIELARPMARWMTRAGAELLADADLLIPVPLHRLRMLRRRYNQAAEITRRISALTGTPYDAFLLQRSKATAPQVGLSRAQRDLNVQGAFHVPKASRARLAGRRVILVDDVLTSGATLNAAARALKRSGARAVDALVFARVVNDAQATI